MADPENSRFQNFVGDAYNWAVRTNARMNPIAQFMQEYFLPPAQADGYTNAGLQPGDPGYRARPGAVTLAAPGAAPTTGIVLAAPPPAAGTPASLAPTRAGDFLQQAIPGIVLTSQDRTPERQRELIAEWERGGRQGVRPADNSWHLQTGRAVDVRKTQGMTLERITQAYQSAGWTVHEALDEGDHFHVAASPPNGGAALGPQLVAPSPAQAMGFIPNPIMLPDIDLPDAPQLAAPAARPLMEQADAKQLLGPLAEALQVEKRDTTNDAWERIQSMLGGAAGAVASGDPMAGIGELILRAGTGGLGGFTNERDEQRELLAAQEAAQREADILLAQAQQGIDLSNLDTRNQNLTIDWQSGEDTRTVNNANLLGADERAVQEILARHGIAVQNVGAYNQAAMTRGQVGAQALNNQADVTNQSRIAGWQSAERRAQALGSTGGIPGAAALLTPLGIPAERQAGEDDQTGFARAAANALAVNNAAGVQNSIAQALLASGTYGQIVDEALGQQIEQAIEQENPGAALVLLNDALRNAPAAVLREELSKLSTVPAVQLYLNNTQAPAR